MSEEAKQSATDPLAVYRSAITQAERQADEARKRQRELEARASELESEASAIFTKLREGLAFKPVEEVMELQARKTALDLMVSGARAELPFLSQQVRNADQTVTEAKHRLQEEEKALSERLDRARYAK